MDPTRSKSYRDAGVDLLAAEASVETYKTLVAQTRTPGVLGDVGGFGGLFSLRDAGVDLRDPVLVSGTDGVGTKLKLAFELQRHDTIGVDCVAMCANDIAVTGARPLFFLDYLATGKLSPAQAGEIVGGIAAACRDIGCALIGGETAEMPGFYPPGEYDVAGFCVGVVDRSEMLGAHLVHPTDVLLGIRSTGFHANGYSLVRKVITQAGLDLHANHGLTETLGEALLRPTRLYGPALVGLDGLHAAAHITGGGFHENLPRVLPPGFGALIDRRTWDVPAVIRAIVDAGRVPWDEAFHVFNMGVGMVCVVDEAAADQALATLKARGYEAARIGSLTPTPGVCWA